MVKPFRSKTHIGNHMLHPETLMRWHPSARTAAMRPAAKPQWKSAWAV
jgi:hypothetical protein